MAEPSPSNTVQDIDIDPALMNGMTQQAPAEQPSTDVEMADSQPTTDSAAPSLQPTVQTQPPTPSQAPPPAAPSAPTLPTAPTPTPASSRNSPHPPAQAPTQPIPHGSPTRVYLNQHVTPHLLEAMKHLATTEPDKPLKWLISTIIATATFMLTTYAAVATEVPRNAAPAPVVTEPDHAVKPAALAHVVARKESTACFLCTASCGFGDGSDCTTCCAVGGPCTC
ncbi:Dpy-30 multi-domain protein [Pyrenophora tritici-repentis]|nr:Dpy-30 domain containing protein [Pyrenophora tritici-repentis]KAI1578072.1 Dpy-30 domain containing protein [Pyrenophora tritici-repentis]PZD03857.1 Dpy-30 multi-domain protein [Pyrenophora tritici-repentis]PZD28455.1 Dpy-30 multi-domain protein [Pyrenophora tritici-repentis]